MHYKKIQISNGSAFDRLHAQLRLGQSGNLPAGGRHSQQPFERLGQLSGGPLAQFSKSLGARFGTTPWKTRQQQEEGDLFGLTADRLREEWIQSIESYIKQRIRSQLAGDAPLRGGSGRISRGQAMAEFASLLNKNISRNI